MDQPATPMKKVGPSERHEKLRTALLDLLKAELAKGDVPADEVLALMSYVVGQLVAMQNQRLYTPDAAMHLVNVNLLQGNADAVSALLNAPTGRMI
jgi:hypothetical protein